MGNARRISATLAGSYWSLWFAGVLARALSLAGGWATALVLATALAVTWWQWRRSATAPPWTVEEAGDAVIGWGFLISAGVLALVVLEVGSEWTLTSGIVIVVAILVVSGLHRLARERQADYLRRIQPR